MINKTTMSTSDEKKQLIEEIGQINEERLGLSPLAARIYALLALSSYDGLTFDEIKDSIQASKSSTSVNLNVLTQLSHVEYYTKSGDRKRYFRVAKNYHKQALERSHQALERDIAMLDKLNSFNKLHYPEKFKKQKSIGSIVQQYYKEQQKLTKKTIEKLAEFGKG
ncbi:MarR family transcriptional regulator [Pricia sp. S334]|uniref:MarR family transcriptional regulator n=1 Tax=Pricia mediterranea TaxID=3076079 RepID=A0ABU3L1E3_9FLAO|nr:MarR family transcriptional regulator [Pricia sp. S334]MDT7827531.1 MarR family transcriptional regulator [Pricia sp. S334]